MKRIYNGRAFCETGCCPVADVDETKKTVTIHDPAKPQNGQFTMTVEEYNTLLANAPKV